MRFAPLFVALLALQPLAAAAPTSSDDVREVVARLVGVVDTSRQAIGRRRAPDVRITTCPVRLTGRDAAPGITYLYQEQALSLELDKPYRQRLLRIGPTADSRVESATFKPKNPETLTGLCARPEAERLVSLATDAPVDCRVVLAPAGDDFVGSTPPEGCAANVRGAVRITNKITLRRDGMDTLDRGFDAAGTQVWGATDDTYQFRRIDPKRQDPELNTLAKYLAGRLAGAGGEAGYSAEPVSIAPGQVDLLVENTLGEGPARGLLLLRRGDDGRLRASFTSVEPTAATACTVRFLREGERFRGEGGCPLAGRTVSLGAIVGRDGIDLTIAGRSRRLQPQ
jgi:hypothetical protein